MAMAVCVCLLVYGSVSVDVCIYVYIGQVGESVCYSEFVQLTPCAHLGNGTGHRTVTMAAALVVWLGLKLFQLWDKPTDRKVGTD